MNQQRFVCVWFDIQFEQSKDSLYTQDELRTIIESFRYFNELNQCLDFIIDLQNLNVILITLEEEIIPIIHYCQQIHSIYILNSNKSTKKDYQKIQGVFKDVKIICQRIKENIIPMKTNPIGISFISSNDIHSNDINRQDPTFMYSQLLKEIILNDQFDESDEETKYEMITYCRHIYSDDDETLKILDQFEQNFLPELSIYWYTRECFLYKILNKALWTPQPDVLYKLRYFLRHLHQEILSRSKSRGTDQSTMIVYRGQNMSDDQIQKFKQNIGGFLSFNNFLSTSLQRDVGLSFIVGPQIGVLFEMFIDTTIEKFPFANIEHLSFQQGPNNEKEMLFSMGTVFRIVGMDTEKNFHRIQLMLTSDIDEQLEEYTRRTHEQIHSSSCFLSFLKLMNELKQYNSVDRFAEMFEKNDYSLMVDPDVLDGIHNVFGLTYHDRGQLNDALEHFHKSLSICLITLPADHPKLAVTYNNIGSVYSAQSDYETALTYHQLALDCQTNSENPNISSIITYTNNIAAIYHHQDKYKEALVYHKRALELQKEYLGENDPSLSDTYNVISIICYKMDDYEQTTSFHAKAIALQEDMSELDPESSAHCSITTSAFCVSQERYSEALEHLNRALQIQEKYFLPNNPSLADTHNYIAGVYYKQNQFEQSLSHHLKALEIERNSLSDDHPSIATSYFSISKDYAGLSVWSDALEYGFKAIEQINKSLQTDVDTLTTFTTHIARIYYQRNEYEKALKYYKEALDLYLTYMPVDDASLVGVYYQTAETYYKLQRYNDALLFYQKTLDIELKTLPDNAKTIATTYSDISASYFSMDRLDEALIAGNQAHDQLLKTLPYNHSEVLNVREFLDKLKMMQMARERYE